MSSYHIHILELITSLFYMNKCSHQTSPKFNACLMISIYSCKILMRYFIIFPVQRPCTLSLKPLRNLVNIHTTATATTITTTCPPPYVSGSFSISSSSSSFSSFCSFCFSSNLPDTLPGLMAVATLCLVCVCVCVSVCVCACVCVCVKEREGDCVCV